MSSQLSDLSILADPLSQINDNAQSHRCKSYIRPRSIWQQMVEHHGYEQAQDMRRLADVSVKDE